MILILDNYDSFTHNLAHLLSNDSEEIEVRRCDALSIEDAEDLDPSLIVLSPGPGRPGERGIMLPLLQRFLGRIPIFGVCLGHQAIAMCFGASLIRAATIVHGKTSLIHHDQEGCFAGVPSPIKAMRYHSLVIDETTLPSELVMTAWTDTVPRICMGIRHRSLPVEGVQFHPESFLTDEGSRMASNVLSSARRGRS